MKLLYIITLLRNKNIKLERNLYNNKTFNKLFNDYTLINKKKENMKINYLKNESKLYPFSPKIENGGYISFLNKNKNNQEQILDNNFCRNIYSNEKEPLNQNFFSFISKKNKNGRNKIRENDLFNGNNNYCFYNFSESDKNNNNNNNFLKYDFFRHNKANPINLKETTYKFQNNKKIISSPYRKNINKQISESLRNSGYKKEKINPKNNNYINSNYLNYNRELNKNKIKNSKYSFNRESFSNNNNHKRENLFNKKNKREINNKNQNGRFNSFIKDIKPKSLFKINNENKNVFKNKNKINNNNNKLKYNNSQNHLNSKSKKSNNIKENNKVKNIYSNKSLNPSSLTFDSNNRRNSKNNIKSTNALLSNLNSTSSRNNEINNHFLKDLKIISGINECFYDFNKDYNKKKYSDELSLQSLSDSKMMELANKYANEDDNSSENYRMNNIVHSKKKYKNKK